MELGEGRARSWAGASGVFLGKPGKSFCTCCSSAQPLYLVGEGVVEGLLVILAKFCILGPFVCDHIGCTTGEMENKTLDLQEASVLETD